uniref:MADS-box transcription factor family protein n=1 Tax=Rhizophora mucronata TaxID=61149 RepID=A0A2P2M551_RHIMU
MHFSMSESKKHLLETKCMHAFILVLDSCYLQPSQEVPWVLGNIVVCVYLWCNETE